MFQRSFCIALLFVGSCFSVAAAAGSPAVPDSDEPVIDIVVEDSSGSATDTLQADSMLVPDIMPELTGFVKADYPADLLKKGVSGKVLLELLVSETGNVDSVTVIKGIHPRLDSCAVAATRKFTFTPAMADSAAVAVLLQYEYAFSIDNVPEAVQTYVNFSGECIERGTKRPVPDAVISVTFIDTISDTALPLPFSSYLEKICASDSQQLDDKKIMATSREDGRFAFYSLPACSIEVRVIVPGYAVFKTREKIVRGEELTARYYVERSSYSDYEVVVYGKAEEKEVSRRQLTVNEVRKIPGFGGDAIKAIQAFPGVSRQMVGSGEVIVRGSPSADSRYFLDGMEIPVLYHFGDLKATYNSEGLSALDFYPGGFGTGYGGAIAGIVDLKSRRGTSERIKGAVELSTLDGSVFVEGPVRDSVTFIASVRRSFIGDVINLIFKSSPETFPFTMYPYYWDYLARTDISTRRHGKFYLSFFGSRDSLCFIYPEMRFGSDEIDEQTDRMGMNTTFHTGVIGWDMDINDRMSASFKYNLMSIYNAFTSGFYKMKQDIVVNHVRGQFSYKAGPRLTFNAGSDMQWNVLDMKAVIATGNGSTLPIVKNNWELGDMAGFLNMEWKPVEQLQLIPGVRYDYYPELLYNGSIAPEFWDYKSFNNDRGYSGEPSVRLNGRYTFRENQTAKFAVGTYNQTPEPMGQAIMKEFGDPMMPATKAAQYVTGYEWMITDLVNLDVQTYLNRQWDIPLYVTYEDSTDGTDGQKNMNHNGLGRMFGLEIMLRHQQGKRFFGWLAYTLSRSERKNVLKNNWEIYSEDETHYLQLVGSWKLPKSWETGFHLKFASGKPTTEILGIMEEDENSAPGIAGVIPKEGPVLGSRMDPAFQLDLRVDKKIISDESMISFFVDLQNIAWFLYKSPDSYMYSDFYDEKEPFSMFPLFAIGARYEF